MLRRTLTQRDTYEYSHLFKVDQVNWNLSCHARCLHVGSPDLNPSEHLWDEVECVVHARVIISIMLADFATNSV